MKTGLFTAIAIHSVAVVMTTGLYLNGDVQTRSLSQHPETTRHQETFQERALRTRASGLINRVQASQAPE
jgi:hypothetical protein